MATIIESARLAIKKSERAESEWSERYGQRHQLVRITEFPASIVPPQKVRIYQRQGHFILQWWDPQAKGNLSDRVEGDLLDALTRARQIDQQLAERRTAGCTPRRLGHVELVAQYLQDLRRRSNAGEISAATVDRYRAALAHYQRFVGQSAVSKDSNYVAGADRPFALAFAAYLMGAQVPPNGHINCPLRPMRRPDFVLDVVRAMFTWAADPHGGHLLQSEFSNPFLKSGVQRQRPAIDPLNEPDVTVPMAAAFVQACDDYQLRLFAPMIFYGLRASEPIFVFHELVDSQWLKVTCLDELGYTTKGIRDKRLPLAVPIAALLNISDDRHRHGLVWVRRSVATGSEKPPLLGGSLNYLVMEYRDRCRRSSASSQSQRLAIRDSVIEDAGGLNYDLIQGEFRRVAGGLGWPPQATLKDFRHLFSTGMANGGLPEYERRYLMGHAPAKGAIAVYTHLNKLAEHYEKAFQLEFRPICDVLATRILRS